MILDILWVLLISLIFLNFRQYRKKDIEELRNTLSDLRQEIVRVSTFKQRNSGNREGGVHNELTAIRDELAVLTGQERNTEKAEHKVSLDSVKISPGEGGSKTINGT